MPERFCDILMIISKRSVSFLQSLNLMYMHKIMYALNCVIIVTTVPRDVSIMCLYSMTFFNLKTDDFSVDM